MLPKRKISLMAYILKILGIGDSSLKESIERIRLADKKMEQIEQVTMSWCVEDLSKEERKRLGL